MVQDIYFAESNISEQLNEETTINEIIKLIEQTSDETLEKAAPLLEKLNLLLCNKIGVDKNTFSDLKKEQSKNYETYRDLFDAIEEELISKGDMKLQVWGFGNLLR